ncbi:MAG: tRNA (adenosine(37)-N6)-dimethylallyltransferase MiaA [Actinomycetota bacterium]
MSEPRHLVLVGATASGKSTLALEAAERHGLEIVSMDSMQVYRGMDIGTAKPTGAEQDRVRHHLIDLVDPATEWTVAEHQHRALEVLDRADRPLLLVGGTGLYVRAVVDRLELPGRHPDVAAELEAEPDTAALHARLIQLDPTAAARMEPDNRRRVLRALEVTIGSGRRFSSYGPGLDTHPDRPGLELVGLAPPRSVVDERIARRYETQLAEGFVDEVRQLLPVLGRTAGQALGYRELAAHVRGETSLDAAVDEAVRRTRRFARRQERWFRRDPRWRWLGYDESPAEVANTLDAIVAGLARSPA